MWNDACNDWALSFNDYADIMVEAKCKNLASIELYEYANTRKNKHGFAGSVDVQQSQDWTRNETVSKTEALLLV